MTNSPSFSFTQNSLQSLFIRDLSISLLIIMLFIGLKTELKVPFLILGKIWPHILIFYIFLFFLYFSQQNLHLSKKFIITNDTIYQIIDSSAINSYNDFITKRLERKTGQKRDQVIPINSIKTIKIDKNKIQIKSFDFNILNANGRIEIPREVTNYGQAVEQLRQIANDSKEIKLVDKLQKIK